MTGAFRLRAARAADVAALSALAHEAKRHWGYPDAWIEAWRDGLTVSAEELGRNAYAVAECDGALAGFVAVSYAGSPRYAEIEHLWVHPRFMRRGCGRALLSHAMDEAARHRVHCLRIVSDPNAEPFYRALGARRVGLRASIPEPRVLPVLELPLPAAA